MEAVPVTRVQLESLTTSELIRMADNLGIDIPPDLDRIFIIEELLEITSSERSAGDSSDTADSFISEISSASNGTHAADMENSGLIESVPLPRQYNITFIEVMIRDPFWAFVFWEIKAQDKDQFEKSPDFEGYYLKVSPWVGSPDDDHPPDSVRRKIKTEGVFTVPVSTSDTAWYLGLSPAVQRKSNLTQCLYKVELCASLRGEETVLAVSSLFRLPLLHDAAHWDNPLIRISGYEDFHILRNNERLFRTKKCSPSGSYE